MLQKFKSWFASNNATHTLSRKSDTLPGLSHNGKRNINEVYGYPSGLNVSFSEMYQMAVRASGIANRLTFGTARTCWRQGFEVFDGDNQVLDDEVSALVKRELIKKIERADVLNRIGPFSVLYVGVPDGRDPKEPVGPVMGDGFKSIYFKPFGFDGIQINSYVTDPTNPRFGLPEFYTVQKQSRGDIQKDTQQSAMMVHWTRIIHMSELSLDSDVEGMGYLQPIYNALLDLVKTRGGSSEAYFRNAKGKIAYEMDKEFAASINDEDTKNKLDEGAKSYTNEYQDHTFAVGSTVKSLSTPHASPRDTEMVALHEIAGYSGYPIRVLTGEGSGQLAGSEDQLAVNAIIQDRQALVCSSWVVRLFEILAMAKMIEWKDSYEIVFPKQDALTQEQEANINNKRADTIAKIAQAKNGVGGDELNLESTLNAVGISEVTENVD